MTGSANALEMRDLSAGYGASDIITSVTLAGRRRAGSRRLRVRTAPANRHLMKTLVGLLRPRRGQILIDGRDVTQSVAASTGFGWTRLRSAGTQRLQKSDDWRKPSYRLRVHSPQSAGKGVQCGARPRARSLSRFVRTIERGCGHPERWSAADAGDGLCVDCRADHPAARRAVGGTFTALRDDDAGRGGGGEPMLASP